MSPRAKADIQRWGAQGGKRGGKAKKPRTSAANGRRLKERCEEAERKLRLIRGSAAFMYQRQPANAMVSAVWLMQTIDGDAYYSDGVKP